MSSFRIRLADSVRHASELGDMRGSQDSLASYPLAHNSLEHKNMCRRHGLKK